MPALYGLNASKLRHRALLSSADHADAVCAHNCCKKLQATPCKAAKTHADTAAHSAGSSGKQ